MKISIVLTYKDFINFGQKPNFRHWNNWNPNFTCSQNNLKWDKMNWKPTVSHNIETPQQPLENGKPESLLPFAKVQSLLEKMLTFAASYADNATCVCMNASLSGALHHIGKALYLDCSHTPKSPVGHEKSHVDHSAMANRRHAIKDPISAFQRSKTAGNLDFALSFYTYISHVGGCVCVCLVSQKQMFVYDDKRASK